MVWKYSGWIIEQKTQIMRWSSDNILMISIADIYIYLSKYIYIY